MFQCEQSLSLSAQPLCIQHTAALLRLTEHLLPPVVHMHMLQPHHQHPPDSSLLPLPLPQAVHLLHEQPHDDGVLCQVGRRGPHLQRLA
jgi:hypothetical protein